MKSHIYLSPLVLTLVFSLSAAAQKHNNAVSFIEDREVCVFETEASAEKDGSTPSTMMASFVEMGKPTGGYNTITDMVEFNGRLYLTSNKDPLGDWGAKVYYTTDGVSYTNVLSDNTSQGYLRMGVFDNKLYVPDGDPNGMDPSFVYISSTGNPSSFTQTQVTSAVHTFDVIKYNNKFFTSNGLGSGQGGLNKFNGTSQWSTVYSSASAFRMKYMVEFMGKLFVANSNQNSDVDLFIWNGDAESTTPTLQNSVTGYSATFRLYASSMGKIYWTVASNNQIRCLVASDGNTWTPVTGLNGTFVSDYADLNGKVYALSQNGLWESADGINFTNIAAAPSSFPDAFKPVPVSTGGYNSDAMASMEAYNGALYCGSSLNGKVYKVTIATTSAPETSVGSTQYQVTDHSVIFDIKDNSSVSLRVYNLLGSLVKNIPAEAVSTGKHEIDLSELKEGMYLLQATVGSEVKGIKFVKR